MINEDLIEAWLEDFNKEMKSDDITQQMANFLKLRGQFFQNEPKLAALISQIMAISQFNNPTDLGIQVAAIVYDLLRRKQEADKLKEEFKL